MSILSKWVGDTQRSILTEEEINIRNQNILYIRDTRLDGIKHCLEMLLWCSIFVCLLLVIIFCVFIFVMKAFNFFNNVESIKIDSLFYEIVKISVYGIGSILVKDAAKKKFEKQI